MKPSIKEHAEQIQHTHKFERIVCERMAYDRYIAEQEIVSEEWRNKYVEETKRCNALTDERKNLVKRSVLENLFTSINKLKSCLESDGIRVQSDNLPMDLEFGASCSGVDEAIKEAHEELQRTRPLWAS